ncbi:MAG: ATP synthase F1 subunit delta [Lachnospiraceae bacterium]|nr:ATP synthase F1 subunit delta [Lachnospiraceae bacterium]MBP5249494.1 ATP synthase F1 subunit delta [Lachnospiraceae bacterium]
MAKLITKTYGDALFDLAREENKIDLIYEQIEVLSQVFKENPDLKTLLTHPKITSEEKLECIKNILEGRVDQSITGFISLIIEKERAKDLEGIFAHFKTRVYEYRKIGIVFVTSAVSLSDDQKKKIEANLLKNTKYTSLETTYTVDESLIGGMTVRIGDRVVDSSIKNQLDKMTAGLRKVSLAN